MGDGISNQWKKAESGIFRFSFNAGEGDFPCAVDGIDSKGFHEAEEFGDFAFTASEFDGEAVVMDIHDFATEDVGNLHDLSPIFARVAHLNQDQLAVDRFPFAIIHDFDDVVEFIELFDDLFESGFVAVGDNGHAGQFRLMGWGHVEAVDIVSTATEETGNPCEDSEFVLNKYGNSMSHERLCFRIKAMISDRRSRTRRERTH